MTAASLFELCRIHWPTFKTERAEFLAGGWGDSISGIPDTTVTAALKAFAQTSKWPPTLAEFRGLVGASAPRLERELACAGCQAKVRGAVALAKHEATCAAAEALYEAGRKRAAEALAGFKARLRGAL